MRVKMKGFELGKWYETISLVDSYLAVYFSRKDYVLLETYNTDKSGYKIVKTRKKYFKRHFKHYREMLIEMEVEDDDNYWDWTNDYACENYCCSCCGCSCYDYEDDDYGSYFTEHDDELE